MMPAPLLTAIDSVGHVHLIVGSNPLASARCARSIEVGAKPKIVAPANAEVHYVLAKRIEEGEVEWIKEGFEDAHLTTLGRDEVDTVVDAVFVTSNGKSTMSIYGLEIAGCPQLMVFYRYPHLDYMQAEADTSQCGRCAQSLHVYSAIHPLGWPSTNWDYYFRQRLQARIKDTTRNRFISPT
jgi:hypothetical protein